MVGESEGHGRSARLIASQLRSAAFLKCDASFMKLCNTISKLMQSDCCMIYLFLRPS
jgi:hypothetical protein